MNVSKIVWSAKDQAKVIEAKEKKKHSMQMSSSYIAKSEYAQSHNKESPITIKNVEEGNVQMTNGNVLQGKESLGSFQMKNFDIGLKHQQAYRNNSSGGGNDGTIGREDRINQIGNEDKNDYSKTFTARIPISVCALPCNVGEKKVMSTVRSKFIMPEWRCSLNDFQLFRLTQIYSYFFWFSRIFYYANYCNLFVSVLN